MEIVRQLLAVLLVFAALGAAVWALRKNGSGGWSGLSALKRKKTGRLETIERVALSPHHALHLVRFGERALLIASHNAGCTLLESAPWRETGGETGLELPR